MKNNVAAYRLNVPHATTNESYGLTQFNDLGLAESLLRAVSAEGYATPTPIQAEVIPAMLAQQDILGIAQTGTGKTASFVLPLLDRICRQKKRPAARQCGALILAPTRELAAQIADSIRSYGSFMRHSVAVIVGGAKPGPQVRAMAQGLDIIVATPGRLEDHLSAGALRLDATTTVVLDEADQMMDLGFMPAIRRILAKLPRARQTVLLSATMPKQIRALAQDFLNNPAEISVTPVSKPIDRIDQKVMYLDKAAKRQALADILSGNTVERAIVFTRTKRGADRVKQHLDKAALRAAAIHGNKSQGQRQRTLAAFRSGETNILVATDIAARGIDVDGVSHVVNFELPNVPEAYVHRIGRTARAGKSGVAISLCDATERDLLRDIEKLIGAPLESLNGPAPKTAPAPQSPAGKEGPKKADAGEGRKRRRRRSRNKTAEKTGASAKAPRTKTGRRPATRSSDSATAGLVRMLGHTAG